MASAAAVKVELEKNPAEKTIVVVEEKKKVAEEKKSKPVVSDDEEEEAAPKKKSASKVKLADLADETASLQEQVKRRTERRNVCKKTLQEQMRRSGKRRQLTAGGEYEWVLTEKAKKPSLKLSHVEEALKKHQVSSTARDMLIATIKEEQEGDGGEVTYSLKMRKVSVKGKSQKIVSAEPMTD